MSVFNIIKRPIITEKSEILRREQNVYTFEVDNKANKIEVEKAVAKKIKPKREKKAPFINKKQLSLPFEEPEYRQVAELKKIINKIIKPP